MSLESANWSYAESFVTEDDVILEARDIAEQLGCAPVLPGSGVLLTLFAKTLSARSVVEIGTGSGVGALYLLRGMHPSGVLTTIDVEPEHQKAARRTLSKAGISAERARMISGRALDVLPRLADNEYDIVFVDARKSEYPAYVEQALRLLKVGGLVILDNALWHGRVADPAQRDPDTTAVRETLKAIRANEQLQPALVPSGDGLLVAMKVAVN